MPRNSSNGVYRTLTGAGYLDPLARTGKPGAAKKLVQANLRTVNSRSRKAPLNPNRNVIDLLLVTPMRVAEWETELVDKLPKALRGSLPTVEEIEAELGGTGATPKKRAARTARKPSRGRA